MSNFDFAMSAKISALTVQEMIKKAVEEQTGQEVKSVTFDVSAVGDVYDRSISHQFGGAQVVFSGKPVVKPSASYTGIRNSPTEL